MDEITTSPKVSVVMGSYNGEAWIAEQIHSILPQLSPTDEFIICDDCSTDQTVAIITNINDSRIKLSVNSHNLGPWDNIVSALKKATGDIIFVCDQDDLWESTKYTDILTAFTPNTNLILHDATIIDGHSEILFDSYFEQHHVRNGVLANIIKNSYTGCFMAFRRDFLTQALPFPKGVPYDQWLGLSAELQKSTLFVKKRLVQWRRHGGNVTDPLNIHSKTPPSKRAKQLMVRFRISILLFAKKNLKY